MLSTIMTSYKTHEFPPHDAQYHQSLYPYQLLCWVECFFFKLNSCVCIKKNYKNVKNIQEYKGSKVVFTCIFISGEMKFLEVKLNLMKIHKHHLRK